MAKPTDKSTRIIVKTGKDMPVISSSFMPPKAPATMTAAILMAMVVYL